MNDKYMVFLVDDDNAFLEMLKEYLYDEGANYELKSFQLGEDCLNYMHMNPEIVVLDYFLNSKNPNAKNGLEILRKIKEINNDTQVIILSAQEDANLVYEFVRENAYTYIPKDEKTFDKVKKAILNIIEK